MTKTRLEINFVRLLNQCKAMANSNNYNDWRFEQYINTLEEYLQELRKSPMAPSKETLDEHGRSIAFLKSLVIAEKLPSASVKVVASQLLSPSYTSYDDPVSKEIQLKATTKYTNELRDELLHTTKENSDQMELRKRRAELLEVAGTPATSKDAEMLIKNEQKKQEELTSDLLLLARSLKEQTRAANAIVKQDIDSLAKSNQTADTNQSNLQAQTMKLRQHRGYCTRCWIWLLLALVCCAFISMVVFMKLFKKRSA